MAKRENINEVLDWSNIFESNDPKFLKKSREDIARRASSLEFIDLDLEEFKADLRGVGISTRGINTGIITILYCTALNSQLAWLNKELQIRS